ELIQQEREAALWWIEQLRRRLQQAGAVKPVSLRWGEKGAAPARGRHDAALAPCAVPAVQLLRRDELGGHLGQRRAAARGRGGDRVPPAARGRRARGLSLRSGPTGGPHLRLAAQAGRGRGGRDVIRTRNPKPETRINGQSPNARMPVSPLGFRSLRLH